jgi:8-oxo-dGTP diphosphatase
VHAPETALSRVPDAELLRVDTVMIEVAAALIRDEAGRYLITRRRRGTHLEGLWEFPGGKRESHETIEACLRRELTEELSATFAIGDKVATICWDYPEASVLLYFFRCHVEAGTIAPGEAQEMAWVEPQRLADYAFPPADQLLITRLMTDSLVVRETETEERPGFRGALPSVGGLGAMSGPHVPRRPLSPG